MNMKLLLLVLISLNSCSSIFWREGSLSPEISFSENGKSFIYSTVKFHEKDSWNPLNGTTEKKNFSTTISSYTLNSDLTAKKIRDIGEFKFWIKQDSLLFNENANTVLLINGTTDQIGTENRNISLLNLKSSETKISYAKLNSVIDATLSSNAENLAIVIKEKSEFYLLIYNSESMREMKKINLSDLKYNFTADGDSDLVWIDTDIIAKGYNSCVKINSQTFNVQSCKASEDYKSSPKYLYRKNKLSIDAIKF